MREIKFRGKGGRTNNWITGSVIILKEGAAIYGDFPTERAVRLETIGQYTCLKDKNGKEIYEGDIVKDADGEVGYITFLQQEMGFVIVGRDRDSRLGHSNRGSGYELDNSIEIIGNIHDNPELLKRKRNE